MGAWAALYLKPTNTYLLLWGGCSKYTGMVISKTVLCMHGGYRESYWRAEGRDTGASM